MGYKSSGGEMVWNEELEKEIPISWNVKPFTQATALGGGGTPSTKNDKYWNGEIPFFTPADVSKSYYTIKTEKALTEKGLENCSSKLYPKNTVFVTARGTVGAIALAGVPMAMNQSCYAIQGTQVNQFFSHQLTIHTIKRLKNEALGAVFNALVTKDFDGQHVVVPNGDTVKLFEKQIQPTYNYLLINSKQAEFLRELLSILLARMTIIEG